MTTTMTTANAITPDGLTTSNCIDYHYSGGWWGIYPPYVIPQQPPPPTWVITTPMLPAECCGDVHVFPCKKCGECKCGKAKLAA